MIGMVRGRPKRRKRLLRRQTSLDEVIVHLQHVHSAAIVAVAALRRQNCELDEDVARLLQRCVCDSLHDQLGQLEELRAARPPAAAHARRLIPL